MSLRVLIDESLPHELIAAIEGHEARTVQEEGWSSISNGELLRRAAQSGFQIFLTPDRNLQYQQNIPQLEGRWWNPHDASNGRWR